MEVNNNKGDLKMAYNDGKVCDWFENHGFSSCFLNGSLCCCPFSKKGCEIQCVVVFKDKPEGKKANRYSSEERIGDNKKLTKDKIFKRLEIKKGEAVADYFIPYSKLDICEAPSEEIRYGIDQVKDKFKKSEYRLQYLRMYHNVEIMGQLGFYIIGTD